MLKNYIKIAYRNLLSKKGYSALNILGLSIGMTCCLLIFQYVAFEYSFDRFHQNERNLYRILQTYARPGDELDQGHAFTAQSLAPALAEGVPEIVNVARLHSDNAVVSTQAHPERVFEEDGVLYVDPAFLKMFSFSLLKGDAAKTLEPGTVLLSQSMAEKYFGAEDPIGQVLEVTGRVEKSYRITGVLSDVPHNSHLRFGVLLPIDDLLPGEDYSSEPEGGWSWNNFSTYIQLHAGANPEVAERKMTEVYLRHRGEVLQQQGWKSALHVQPLRDIHLNDKILGAGNIVNGSYETVYFFFVVGLITLIIALVNYVNLATARAVSRGREVGVRKVVGARRGQLVMQFLCESGLTNIAAAALAVVFASLLIPVIDDVAETQLSGALWMSPGFWLAFLLTLAIGTLLAGLYPAFVLSSFRPTAMPKGNKGSFATHLWLRRALVVCQFTASIVLVAGTVIVYDQLNYMQRMDLGLNLQHVLTVQGPRILPEGTDRAVAINTFLQELRRVPGVAHVAASSTLPGQGFNWNGAAIRKATDDPANAIQGVATYIDTSFARVYGLELVAGKEFGDITVSDADDAPWPVIVNETTIKTLGFTSPSEAVDQALNIGGNEVSIIGVFKDFNWSSAHEKRQNIVFGNTVTGRHISVKLGTTNLPGTITRVQEIYESLFSGNVFRYAFADEVFDRQYRNDQRFATLFTISAGMAIFIACLGLFGLAAFTAQQRTKEIGMRKVLGATVTNIVGLLSKDFLKLVIIGFFIAVPIALYTMNHWLENFAYRIEIGAGIFLLAGVVAILIALATVSWQSIRAALANPVDSLRYE
jgi:putative ABC transport system permease protein